MKSLENLKARLRQAGATSERDATVVALRPGTALFLLGVWLFLRGARRR